MAITTSVASRSSTCSLVSPLDRAQSAHHFLDRHVLALHTTEQSEHEQLQEVHERCLQTQEGRARAVTPGTMKLNSRILGSVSTGLIVPAPTHDLLTSVGPTLLMGLLNRLAIDVLLDRSRS